MCVKGLKPGVVQKHSWVRTKEHACLCNRRSRLNVTVDHGGEECQMADVWTHKGCVHNELAALVSRHQLAATPCTRSIQLRHHADALAAQVLEQAGVEHLEPSSRRCIVNKYKGGKKKLMERALESLNHESINSDDAKVRMFIKADKFHDPEVKAPRAIQYRSKKYCLELARFVHPIEEALYSTIDWTGTTMCAKGRNLKERAADLLEKSKHFSDPLFVCLDHSKFDAHITTELLKIESHFYQRLFAGGDRKKIRYLMRMQLVNKGTTKSGTTYKTNGTRMSGDQNTALGNTALNMLILTEWLGNIKHSMYVDGDDSVVIIECADEVKLPPLASTMAEMSMETKIETTKIFEHVDFCQSRPVETQEGWRLVRNPTRVLSRIGWSVYPMSNLELRRWVRSVGLCEMVTGRGVPILQQIGLLFSTAGNGRYLVTDKHYDASHLQHQVDRVKPISITASTRYSFEQAWGISVEQQLLIEHTLRVSVCGQRVLINDEYPFDR